MLPPSPLQGMTSTQISGPTLKDLSAQKMGLFAPTGEKLAGHGRSVNDHMDLGIILAIALLALWAVGTALSWAGWVHGLLTAGVFLLIWRVVTRTR